MKKADWLALAAHVLIVTGLGMTYLPAGFIAAGISCFLLARAANSEGRVN